MDLPVPEKQELLETFDVRERLDKVSQKLGYRLEVLRLSKEISQQTKGSMEKAQREYYLREQLKTIQKELGEGDAKSVEMKEISEAITAAKMPPDVEKEARKELTRLERMPEAAAEYAISAPHHWLVELPWSVKTEDAIDIRRAREILEEDHYGLDKVKKRILEFLAVRKLKPEGKSPILCLVGPPGVGKTSLGQSLARAMGRKFVRISLGGVHDEAEVRGHRRTYIGALPGNIIRDSKAGSMNPVFMLDSSTRSAQATTATRRPRCSGARPGASSTFRDLPRGSVRPQPGHVRRHRERDRRDPRTAPRPLVIHPWLPAGGKLQIARPPREAADRKAGSVGPSNHRRRAARDTFGATRAGPDTAGSSGDQPSAGTWRRGSPRPRRRDRPSGGRRRGCDPRTGSIRGRGPADEHPRRRLGHGGTPVGSDILFVGRRACSA
jgi:hypothetical protein